MYASEVPDPIAVVRKVTINKQESFRAVTWALRSDQRTLIGYFPTGDAAAEACWGHYLETNRARHEVASRTHGSWQRGVPEAEH